MTRSLACILYKTGAEVKGCLCEEEGARGELQTSVKGESEVVMNFLKGSSDSHFQVTLQHVLGLDFIAEH